MPTFDYPARMERARALLAARGADVLLLSVGADLPYLTGYRAMPLERLTMLVLPRDGAATLVVPALEAPRVTPCPGAFRLEPWDEGGDPVAVVAQHCGGAGRIAVGDTTWSVFTLALQERLPGAAFVAASPLTGALRARKEPGEIDLLRRAGAAADRVVARLDGARFSGKMERQVAAEVAALLVEEGHEAAAFGIVGSGPNSASPHHEAGERVIERGDALVLDFGGRVQGYHSDITRTFFVGDPGARFREVYGVVREAQAAGVHAAGPGVPAQEVDRAARRVIAGAGYGPFFIHRTGHGIGLEEHEPPYLVEGNAAPLEPGMAFSVEPGIYLPGEFGVRIEDIVALTATGVEPLNAASHDMHLVD